MGTLTKLSASPYALKYRFNTISGGATGGDGATLAVGSMIADAKSGPLRKLLMNSASLAGATFAAIPDGRTISIVVTSDSRPVSASSTDSLGGTAAQFTTANQLHVVGLTPTQQPANATIEIKFNHSIDR